MNRERKTPLSFTGANRRPNSAEIPGASGSEKKRAFNLNAGISPASPDAIDKRGRGGRGLWATALWLLVKIIKKADWLWILISQITRDPSRTRRNAVRYVRTIVNRCNPRFRANNRAKALSIIEASGLFDREFYIKQHPELVDAKIDLLEHYLDHSIKSGSDPSPDFSTSFYLERYSDVRKSRIHPFLHYVSDGRREGRPCRPNRSRARAEKVKSPVPPEAHAWETLAAERVSHRAEALVDIVMPVYGQPNETLHSIYRVLTANPATSFELVVVDDRGPDSALSVSLADLAARGLFTLVVNDENMGFVASANRGMSLHPNRDVVLLNSDTAVYNDWLDRLRAAALRDIRTGTATPFSNNAEICNYPAFVRNHDEQMEIDDAELDLLAAKTNPAETIEIPTGVGFCMYVRRDCINDVGLFDVVRFGRGYGEENDFCQRAIKSGWINVLAADVFVRHYGGVSFGKERRQLMKQAIKMVDSLHPSYSADVRTFILSDPIRHLRERLDASRIGRLVNGAILFVTHDWGGGTERHIQDLRGRLEESGTPVFILRSKRDHVGVLELDEAGLTGLYNLPTINSPVDLRHFVSIIDLLRVRHIHVHHLIGAGFGAGDFIRRGALDAGITYDVTLHDQLAACPRISMVDGSGVYCGAPTDHSVCQRCVAENGSMIADVVVWQMREEYDRLLGSARHVFVPSHDLAGRMTRYYPEPKFVVRPHETKMNIFDTRRSETKAVGRPVRVALIGALNEQKGSHLVLACAVAANESAISLEFVIIGYTDIDGALASLPNVTLTGPYKDAELQQKLAENACNFAWFPAVGPETFNYALSGAFGAGIYPVAFDLGATAERIRLAGWGQLLPLTLMKDPSGLVAALEAVEVVPPPLNLASKIEVAYEDVLHDYYGIIDPISITASH